MNITEKSLKLRVITEVRSHGRLLSEVARQYGLSSKTVYRWLRESEHVHASKHQAAIRAEIARLQRQLQKLEPAET
jgi:transposase